MTIRAPKYYKDFKCIADRCTHSCCIGWEIDIDPVTMEKYASLSDGYGKTIADSIDSEDTPHFRLYADERCPHLDERGLCKIISNLGENYLCDICREHPRFYNDTSRGKEVGLGMACEEAARLILSSDDYGEMIEVGTADDFDLPEFDGVIERERIYTVLSDQTVPYQNRLASLYAEYDTFPSTLTDIEWREVLDSLEYLDESHRELFRVYRSDLSTDDKFEHLLERALAYFVYRHCSATADEEEVRATLGFALFCERLLSSLVLYGNPESIVEYARIISEELEYSEENTERIKEEFLFA
ncbi:MAG: hypothetical protein E7628_05195 [Ruminococcaceae bacterium]|nr:hypothetical protein [Oscillospiraceae bacterium]